MGNGSNFRNTNTPARDNYQSRNGAKSEAYKVFSQQRGRILTRSLLIASICYLLIGIIGVPVGLGFCELMKKELTTSPNSNWMLCFALCSIFLILISAIGSRSVLRKQGKSGTTGMIIWLGLYCIGQIIGFGMLFGAIAGVNYVDSGSTNGFGIWWVTGVFAFCGLVFGICALVGYNMSSKAAFKLSKFLTWCWTLVFTLSMILIIPTMFVMIFSPSIQLAFGFNLIMLIIYGATTLMFMLYITWDVWVIAKKSTELESYVDDQYASTMSLYYGYTLLTDLMSLFWILILFLIRLIPFKR